MENNRESLVTVLTASLLHEIHIAKGLLASKGINSFIFDENLMTTMGTAYVEGYKLEVSSKDFEKAKKILSEIETEDK